MKTFVDFTYECEEAVFSDQHQAYLVEYFQDPSDLPQTYDIDCYQSITSRYAVVYQRSDEVIAGQYQGKLIVPRCFGFLEENYEPDSAANAGPGSSALLEAAGITRARQEPLSLDGRGMLIGIIDSGGGVRMGKTNVLPLQEFLRNSCWRFNTSRRCSGSANGQNRRFALARISSKFLLAFQLVGAVRSVRMGKTNVLPLQEFL